MAEALSDQQLLREFTDERSEGAFEALVKRHVDLVFATALRQVSQEQPAQEITQNVFIALARKAVWLRGEQALSGWLYKTTLLEARQWWRGEYRRQHREQTAAELGTTMKEDDSLLKSLTAVLDEALMELRQIDREALLLRFFEDRTHGDIGLVLGVGEDAVRKRIDKALDQVTRFFRRNGYAVPVATAAAALRQAAQAAPVGLSAAATKAALAAGSGASGIGVSLLFAKIMGLTKMQTGLVCVALAAIPIVYQEQVERGLRVERASLTAKLESMDQVLRATERKRGELLMRSRQQENAAAVVQPKMTAGPVQNQATANERPGFVQVPKDLLAKIKIPAVGTDGLLTDDMARALSLDGRQTSAVNEALTNFGARYRELEVAHWHPTGEHPTSMHVSPIADQKTFICDAFPEDYDRLMAELKSALDETMGRENSEYFWANTGWTGHEELDPDRGPLAKRITLFRPSKEEPGGGPYYLGEEYQFKNGNWGSAHFGPLQEDSRIEFPMVKQVIADWKRSAATR